MSYIINLGCWQSVFAVPSELVDKHLRLANAAHIKVLLYILRHSGQPIEPQVLSNAVGLSLGDIEDALAYWQACGLLARNEGELLPPDYTEAQPIIKADVPAEITVAATASTDAKKSSDNASDNTTAADTPAAPKRVERVRYTYSECAEYINSSADIRQMLPVLEGLLQKQLNHTEISVFVTLVHWYGLPVACVALLVEYCRSIGKGTIAYIESTGIGWAGEEIDTVEKASQKITRLRTLSRAWLTVRTALDIPERKATKKEEEYCDRWINDYQLGTDMIKLAFDRCVDKKGKLSMSYMNGIIENWHKLGITTVEQAENDSSAPAKTSGTGSGRYEPTYDKSDIETVMYDEWFSDDDDI